MLRMLNYSPVELMLARLGSLVLLVVAMLGCSYAKGPPYVVEGERFPDDKLSIIHEGMSAAEVTQILGEPYEIEQTEDGVRWRYYVWQRQDETIRYLGLIPIKKPLYNGMKEAVLLLRDGVVQEVAYEHKTID